MRTCTFFGHRECPDVKGLLQAVIEELITQQGVDCFYVQFDAKIPPRAALCRDDRFFLT